MPVSDMNISICEEAIWSNLGTKKVFWYYGMLKKYNSIMLFNKFRLEKKNIICELMIFFIAWHSGQILSGFKFEDIDKNFRKLKRFNKQLVVTSETEFIIKIGFNQRTIEVIKVNFYTTFRWFGGPWKPFINSIV